MVHLDLYPVSFSSQHIHVYDNSGENGKFHFIHNFHCYIFFNLYIVILFFALNLYRYFGVYHYNHLYKILSFSFMDLRKSFIFLLEFLFQFDAAHKFIRFTHPPIHLPIYFLYLFLKMRLP
jgi:hypothetical protein